MVLRSVEHKGCMIVKNSNPYKAGVLQGRTWLMGPPGCSTSACLMEGAGWGRAHPTSRELAPCLPSAPAAPIRTNVIIPRTQVSKFACPRLVMYATGTQAALCALRAAPGCAGSSWNGTGLLDGEETKTQRVATCPGAHRCQLENLGLTRAHQPQPTLASPSLPEQEPQLQPGSA